MKRLVQEKQKAVLLRKKGYSYNEILQEIPVAKSSLSLWLKDLPLTQNEKNVLKQRKSHNITHGRIKAASELRKKRLAREKVWFEEATDTFSAFKNDRLFHTGISLYWAEGAKRSNQWQFSNSDVQMVKIMLLWLEEFLKYNRKDLKYRIYAHAAYADTEIEQWWKNALDIHGARFGKTTRKPTQFAYRKRPSYRGCFRIEVPKSKHLLCKMRFWTNMLVEYNSKR